MGNPAPQDVVDRQIEAYNRHDIDAFVDCYSPDIVIESENLPRMRGHDELKASYLSLWQAFPDISATITNRLVTGDTVIDFEEAEMTHSSSIRGIAPTGDKIRMRAVVIYHVSHGLIDKVTLYRDEAFLSEQLGNTV